MSARIALSQLRMTRSHVLLVIVALLTVVLVPITVARAGAASISVVDYAQCANGASGTACSGGWINGVLQDSNSHYQETDVTPQRLEVKAAAGAHSVTLSYLARKGDSTTGTHAYDGLATWDKTVLSANATRCAGLSTPQKADLSCDDGTGVPVAAPTSTLPIPADPFKVNPVAGGASAVTSGHVPAGQYELFGPSGTAFVSNPLPTYSHSSSDLNGDGTGDDYVTTTIAWTQTTAGNVQILFGGHLAASPLHPIGGENGWGGALGAANINGGPYHIKWAAADLTSVGSRDNQIMGGSIDALGQSTISSTSSPNVTLSSSLTSVSVSDTATVAIGSTGGAAPTGAVTFDLYGPLTSPPTATSCTSSNRLATAVQGSTLTTTAPYRSVGTVTLATPTPGYYAWIATYAGDTYNTGIAGACGDTGESFQVVAGTPTMGATQRVGAKATVTGFGAVDGTVTFTLYPTSACTGTPTYGPEIVSKSGGIWETAAEVYLTAGTTYYWKIHYNGDAYNSAGDVGTCGGTGGKTILAS